jgi:hypothetical protein
MAIDAIQLGAAGDVVRLFPPGPQDVRRGVHEDLLELLSSRRGSSSSRIGGVPSSSCSRITSEPPGEPRRSIITPACGVGCASL